MYKIQKDIGKINNGSPYITVPNIRKHQIMDKCVLNDLSSQITLDIEVLNRNIERNNTSISKMFTLISNITTNITNAITELESIAKIKDYNDNTLYEENFINAINIDMKSNVDIDFNNNNCSLPSITTNIIGFDSIKLNNKTIDTSNIAYQEYSNMFDLQESVYSVIKCSFTNPKKINNILLEFQASTNINYEIYDTSDEKIFLIDSGVSSSSILTNFYPKTIKSIEIRLLTLEAKATAYLNNIYCTLKAYKKFAEIKTKPLKIYGSSKMKMVIKSNAPNKIKSYIGFINKDNKIIWNSGDTYNSFNLYNDYSNLILDGVPGFGDAVSVNYKITDLKNNFNKNSVSVYSGYGMWHRTLIEGAFMNEDLSVIEYGSKDIKERTYIDVDECNFDVTAGQLFILEQQILVDKEIEIKFPKLESFKVVETEDKTSLFRYAISVNGERINGTMTLSDYFEAKLVKGINNIQVVINLKKLDELSSYSVHMYNYFNAKEYTDFIYHKKLKQSSTASLVNDIYRDNYSIFNNSILLNSINKSVDRFMVKYETLVDSDIHYTDHNGQYMKVILMTKIFNDDSYNNVKINKISLIN